MSGQLLKFLMLVLMCWLPFEVHAANPAVLFVVDSSGSMWGRIEGTEKVYLVRDALTKSISGLPQDADIGLMVYGHKKKGSCHGPELLDPIGSSRDSIIKNISSFTPKGKAPIGLSIDAAIKQIKKRGDGGTVVLLSDGADSCKGDPCKAALNAGDGVRIHVVGLSLKKRDVPRLSCIAENSGGKFFSVDSKASLSTTFALLSREIATLQPAQQASGQGIVSEQGEVAQSSVDQAAAGKAAAEKAAAEKAAAEKAAAEKAAAEKAAAEKAAAEKAAAEKAAAERLANFTDMWDREANRKPPGIIFSDDFDSSYLSDHWTVLNPSTELLHADGEDLVLVTKRSSLADGDVPNLLVLEHEAIGGDYSVSVELGSVFSTGKLGKAKQKTGLLLYRDKKNYLGLIVSNVNRDTFPKCKETECRQVVQLELIKVLKGVPTRIGSPFRLAWQPPDSRSMKTRFDVHLEIDRIGFIYVAHVAIEGEVWYELGRVPFYGSSLNPAIFASSNLDYPYALVQFENIVIRESGVK